MPKKVRKSNGKKTRVLLRERNFKGKKFWNHSRK